jgi:DtxR family transcriptional regulator, Mn-dependent transcriptional regulator
VASTEGHPDAEYLEAIYEMAEEGIPTVQARIGDWMGMSRASVSEHVKRLLRDGLLEADGRTLGFTPEGETIARSLVRRHRLAEHFLIRVIGLPWHKAHEEAGRWERVISDEVEARLVEILHDPATCPHGNPIPGSAHTVDYRRLVALKDIPAGGRATLRRLTEDLELELDVMRFLEESGLMPGAKIEVRGVGPDGTMNLAVKGTPVALGAHLSDNLWVDPA